MRKTTTSFPPYGAGRGMFYKAAYRQADRGVESLTIVANEAPGGREDETPGVVVTGRADRASEARTSTVPARFTAKASARRSLRLVADRLPSYEPIVSGSPYSLRRTRPYPDQVLTEGVR